MTTEGAPMRRIATALVLCVLASFASPARAAKQSVYLSDAEAIEQVKNDLVDRLGLEKSDWTITLGDRTGKVRTYKAKSDPNARGLSILKLGGEVVVHRKELAKYT